MIFSILSPEMRPTAEGARKYLIQRWGLRSDSVRVESPIGGVKNFVPAFHGVDSAHNIVCVEVSSRAYRNAWDSTILDCRESGLPIKIYVAMPKGAIDPEFQTHRALARERGVGLLEIDVARPHLSEVSYAALSQPLTGVRKMEVAGFPKKYRPIIGQAERMYRDGDPGKACSTLYDEIESLTRRLAFRAKEVGLWKSVPSCNFQTTNWGPFLAIMKRELKWGAPDLKPVSPDLWARVEGIVKYRNQSGHKPKNTKELVEIEKQLRTRFEMAGDILKDLVGASKGLKI